MVCFGGCDTQLMFLQRMAIEQQCGNISFPMTKRLGPYTSNRRDNTATAWIYHWGFRLHIARKRLSVPAMFSLHGWWGWKKDEYRPMGTDSFFGPHLTNIQKDNVVEDFHLWESEWIWIAWIIRIEGDLYWSLDCLRYAASKLKASNFSQRDYILLRNNSKWNRS